MSLSTTAFTDRVFPPGTLEWSQQERLRRIQRIQKQREQHRLQSLFLREIRQRQVEVNAARNVQHLLNNNTQLSSSGSVALKKTTSAKVTKNVTNSGINVNQLKKSKSITFTVKASPTRESSKLSQVESQNVTSAVKKLKKAKKTKSKASTAKVAKKSSTAISSTSRKNSSTHTKPSTSKAYSINGPSRSKSATGTPSRKSSKLKVTKVNVTSVTKVPKDSGSSKVKLSDTNVKTSDSKITSLSKVSFSGTKITSICPKDTFYCPVTTPASILKNRQKIDDLCKSTLQPSVASKENLIKAGSSRTEPRLDRVADEDVKFKEFPFASLNPPPQPNIGICKAFPGTKEWDEYWTKFSRAMNKYNKDMTEYEQQAAEAFKDDLARYSEQNKKLTREREIYKNLGAKGVELGLIPPPPITSKELKGLQLFNGYIMKSKGIKGTASNLPGSPTGVRFEIDIRGAEPENVLIQKDHNLLTISMDPEKFLRIGTPSGKLAGDIQIWPDPIDGIIIIDAP